MNDELLKLLNFYIEYIKEEQKKNVQSKIKLILDKIISNTHSTLKKFEFICVNLSAEVNEQEANEKLLIDTIFPLIATQAPHQLFLFSQGAEASYLKCNLLSEKLLNKFIKEDNKTLIAEKIKLLIDYLEDTILDFCIQKPQLVTINNFFSILPTGVYFCTFDVLEVINGIQWHKVKNPKLHSQTSTVSSERDYVNKDLASLVVSESRSRPMPQHERPEFEPTSSPMPPQHQPLNIATRGNPFFTKTTKSYYKSIVELIVKVVPSCDIYMTLSFMQSGSPQGAASSSALPAECSAPSRMSSISPYQINPQRYSEMRSLAPLLKSSMRPILNLKLLHFKIIAIRNSIENPITNSSFFAYLVKAETHLFSTKANIRRYVYKSSNNYIVIVKKAPTTEWSRSSLPAEIHLDYHIFNNTLTINNPPPPNFDISIQPLEINSEHIKIIGFEYRNQNLCEVLLEINNNIQVVKLTIP